jgi:CRP-like cAMP-binding protein
MPALLTEGGLKHHPLLHGCSDTFLNRLEEFATQASFEVGELILAEGGYADRFYLITEGAVLLEAETDGERLPIQVLGAGDVLGWSWLFPPFRWHFSARAIEHTKAVSLNAASLLIRAEEQPEFGYQLLKRISRQVVCRLQATRKRLGEQVKESRGEHAPLLPVA